MDAPFVVAVKRPDIIGEAIEVSACRWCVRCVGTNFECFVRLQDLGLRMYKAVGNDSNKAEIGKILFPA